MKVVTTRNRFEADAEELAAVLAPRDDLLVEVARRLHRAVRSGDTVARLGGDEFVLLFVGMESPREIEITLDRVLEQDGVLLLRYLVARTA